MGIWHRNLLGLDEDGHLQYPLLAGRLGGQTLFGGAAAAENLEIASTAHATKGEVRIASGSVFNVRNSYGNYIGSYGGTPLIMLSVRNQLAAEPADNNRQGISISPYWSPTSNSFAFTGLAGFVLVDNLLRTGTSLFGLDFVAAGWRGSFANLVGCQSRPFQLTGVPTTVTNFESFRAQPFMGTGLTCTSYVSFNSVALGFSGITSVYGLKVSDITAGTNRYLADLGPLNPNLRVEANAPTNPGAGLGRTRILAAFNEGGIVNVRRVESKLFSALVAADKVMVAV